MIDINKLTPGYYWIKCQPKYRPEKTYWDLINIVQIQPGWNVHQLFGTDDPLTDEFIEIGPEVLPPSEL